MTATAVRPAAATLLDGLLPAADATRVEHRVIAGDAESVYEAVRQADFLQTVRSSRAVRVLFGVRGAAERVMSAVLRRPVADAIAPETMRLADLPTHGDWILLGEDPPREVAFGVVGRFWAGETVREQIGAAQFATYDRPGLARIACNFSVRTYGPGSCLVSYECRTQATDPASRRAFLRYWRPLSPFIGLVLRAQLRVVEAQVRAGADRGPRLAPKGGYPRER